MPALPHDPVLDATPALLREGYEFVGNRCRRFGADAFVTRLLLRSAVCISGREAAEVFYVPGRFTRNGALPPSTVRLLQDKGSVQALDGEAHRFRKRMFLDLMSPERLDDLARHFTNAWRLALPDWRARGGVVLLEAVRPVILAAVCLWSGIDLVGPDAARRRDQLVAMVANAGGFGPAMVKALVQRRSAERWARGLVHAVRTGRLDPAPETALARIAGWAFPDGRPIDLESAAVELLNILRPMLAVDRYVVFTALALHRHPEARPALAADPAARRAFVEEVRRFYPFIPMMGGRVLQPFDWRGHGFARGDWVLLDLYGTARDPRTFEAPDSFDPVRFLGRSIGPFDMVPQGGGPHGATHRCPGEWPTIRLMEEALLRLLDTPHDVPDQDLTIPLDRIPTAPVSGLAITLPAHIPSRVPTPR